LPFRGMVVSEIIVDPGRGLIKIPVAWRDDVFSKLFFLPVFLQAGIGTDINALSLFGINLTPPLETAATGAVALVLRALRHWTEVGHIDEGAIPAVSAVKEGDLG